MCWLQYLIEAITESSYFLALRYNFSERLFACNHVIRADWEVFRFSKLHQRTKWWTVQQASKHRADAYFIRFIILHSNGTIPLKLLTISSLAMNLMQLNEVIERYHWMKMALNETHQFGSQSMTLFGLRNSFFFIYRIIEIALQSISIYVANTQSIAYGM